MAAKVIYNEETRSYTFVDFNGFETTFKTDNYMEAVEMWKEYKGLD